MGSSGKRFGLATPVTRGRFSDPDFEAKAQQIREYWQSMTGSPDSHGRSHLTRVPVNSTLGTADQASRWLETSAAPRIRRGLLRMLKIVLPVAFLVALPFAVRDAGPAWAAHLGHGRPGIFTAYAESCNRTCTWYGTFTAADGSYQNGLQLADGGRDRSHPDREQEAPVSLQSDDGHLGRMLDGEPIADRR